MDRRWFWFIWFGYAYIIVRLVIIIVRRLRVERAGWRWWVVIGALLFSVYFLAQSFIAHP